MENGFHGRTLATLSATGNPAKQQGFEPLLPGFLRVPYDDIAAVRQLAEQRDDIVAVLLEPVQGEGGIRVAGADYLRDLRALCDRHGWLLMLDEIQAGMGRTGAVRPSARGHRARCDDAGQGPGQRLSHRRLPARAGR